MTLWFKITHDDFTLHFNFWIDICFWLCLDIKSIEFLHPFAWRDANPPLTFTNFMGVIVAPTSDILLKICGFQTREQLQDM
jgi:hypothetical protein